MLTSYHVTSATDAKNYYSSSDYYADGQEAVGRWGGKLAERFGLAGTVDKESFDRLVDNLHPITGKRLTPRTDGDRKIAYDLTFSGPKSFSVIEGLASPEERRWLLKAFDDAVTETLDRDIEPDMQTRVRLGGQDADRTTGNILCASFDHSTARPEGGKPPDPHRHKHVLIFSATHDPEEKRIKAGQFGNIVRDKPYYRAAFYARLAKKLEGLGYVIDRRGDTDWEIAGVPQSVIDIFSKRTERIDNDAAEKGITDPALKAGLAAKTRGKKDKGLTPEELRAAWSAQLSDAERAALLTVYRKGVKAGKAVTASEAVAYSLHHCLERDSAPPEREIKRVALLYGLGSVTPEAIAAELPRQGVITGEKDGRVMATTRKVHGEELFVTGFTAAGRGTVAPVGVAKGLQRGALDDEQWAAVTGLLSSHDRVRLLDSAAGVGKTTALKAFDQGMTLAREAVTYLGTTTKAVGVLRKDGFEAETVAKFLLSEKLQDAAKNSHVVVDESSLLGHADSYKLFTIAREKNLTLTFLGDSRQHSSVAAGSFMRLLRQYGGVCPLRISTIKRQENAEHKAAVGLMFEGKTLEGFDKIDSLGWVREFTDADERYRAMAGEYVQARKDGESWDQILLLSPTHAEGRKAVDAVRQRLREEGLIGTEEREFTRWVAADLTEAQRGDAHSYRPGLVDMIQYHRNGKGHKSGERIELAGIDAAGLPLGQAEKFQAYRKESVAFSEGDVLRFTANGTTLDDHQIRNGSAYRVAGFTPAGIRLENGWLISKDFGHFKPGIETSFGSQGLTVSRAIIGQSSQSFAASNMEQAYVSASRAKKQVSFYTDDKAELRHAIQRSSLKLTASDIVKPPVIQPPPRQRWRQRLAHWQRLASLARVRAAWQAPALKPLHTQHERRAGHGR